MATVDAVGTGYSLDTVTNNSKVIKDDFLNMLIAQLKYQDPLNPMDGTDFTAQLAQFSSLEQLTNISAGVEALNSQQVLSESLTSVDLIGKEIITPGNILCVNGEPIEIFYSLPENAQAGTIEITRGDGSIVDRIDLGSQEAGERSVMWDCSNVEEGNYYFQVQANNLAGNPLVVDTMMQGMVTGVTFRNGSVYLSVAGQEIPLDMVTGVKDVESNEG